MSFYVTGISISIFFGRTICLSCLRIFSSFCSFPMLLLDSTATSNSVAVPSDLKASNSLLGFRPIWLHAVVSELVKPVLFLEFLQDS